MTLLRYSSHHGAGGCAPQTGRAAAVGVYPRAIKSYWSNSRSTATMVAKRAAAPTTVASSHHSFHWTRLEPQQLHVHHLHQQHKQLSAAPHHHHHRTIGRHTTWRRQPSQDESVSSCDQSAVGGTAAIEQKEPFTDSSQQDSLAESISQIDDHDRAEDGLTFLEITQDGEVTALAQDGESNNIGARERPKSPVSITETHDFVQPLEDASSSASSSQVRMKKRGANQLVRQDDRHDVNSVPHPALHQDDDRPSSSNSEPTVLRKVGSNKLVHTEHRHHHDSAGGVILGPPGGVSCGSVIAAKRKLTFSSRPRKHPHTPTRSHEHAIKRVKLSEATSCVEIPSGGSADGAAEKLMTDFAYRETSSTVSGRRHCRTQDQQVRRRNMGLVRVPPDQSKTPICPTFLQGLACTDAACRKRHDVPKEAATPICSFFQRQGQCLKGPDCPFRHIKVNPRAELCPSFSLLGFCQDEDCLMKHVRSSASGAGAGNNKIQHHSSKTTMHHHHHRSLTLTAQK